MALLLQSDGPRSRGIFIFKPLASTSLFQGVDARGYILAYTPGEGFVDVIRNGVLLSPEAYTATNGTSITLATPAASGDTIIIIAQAAFGVADAYRKSESDERFTKNVDHKSHGGIEIYRIDANNIGIRPKGNGRLIIDGVSRPVRADVIPTTSFAFDITQLIYAYWSGTQMNYEVSGTGRATHTDGVEIRSGNPTRTLVGAVYRATSLGIRDETVNRFIANWFDRKPRTTSISVSGAIISAGVATPVVTCYGFMWSGDSVKVSNSGLAYAHAGAGGILISGIMVNSGGVGIEGHASVFAQSTYYTLTSIGTFTANADALVAFQTSARVAGVAAYTLTSQLTAELML